MARRRYYYRRTIRPKQKWAINNVDIRINATADTAIAGSSNAVFYQVVATNGSRVQTGTGDPATSIVSSAQILKTGRFKLKGCIPLSLGSFSYTFYIAYVPEGYTINTATSTSDQILFYQHPEWIIGWTRKDYLNTAQSNEISITSRLKRNLNTGDQIIVGVMVTNYTTVAQNLSVGSQLLHGVLSYCCRAN